MRKALRGASRRTIAIGGIALFLAGCGVGPIGESEGERSDAESPSRSAAELASALSEEPGQPSEPSATDGGDEPDRTPPASAGAQEPPPGEPAAALPDREPAPVPGPAPGPEPAAPPVPDPEPTPDPDGANEGDAVNPFEPTSGAAEEPLPVDPPGARAGETALPTHAPDGTPYCD